MNFTGKLVAALRGLFTKDVAGQVAMRSMPFDDSNSTNAASSQSPRSLEALVLAAIGLDGNGKPALRMAADVGEGSGSRPYKVYTALISQSALAFPSETILENTLGDIFSITRTGAGVYSFFINSAVLAQGKTVSFTGDSHSAPPGQKHIEFAWGAEDEMVLRTYNSSNVLADDLLNFASVEIRVYP